VGKERRKEGRKERRGEERRREERRSRLCTEDLVSKKQTSPIFFFSFLLSLLFLFVIRGQNLLAPEGDVAGSQVIISFFFFLSFFFFFFCLFGLRRW